MQQFNNKERKELFKTLDGAKKKLKPENTAKNSEDSETTRVSSTKTVDSIDIYPYLNYLYYYPTMHWHLDRTPETNDYWVGIYKAGESNDKNYLHHQRLGKVAQGSYYIGELGNTKSLYSRDRNDEFELRLFKGDECVDAATNIMYGLSLIHI